MFFTKLFTDAHENGSDHPLERAMDLHNNGVGQEVGSSYDASDSNALIESAVRAMLDTGQLKYLNPTGTNGQILSTTQIRFTNQ